MICKLCDDTSTSRLTSASREMKEKKDRQLEDDLKESAEFDEGVNAEAGHDGTDVNK